jgi:hypothetical protein
MWLNDNLDGFPAIQALDDCYTPVLHANNVSYKRAAVKGLFKVIKKSPLGEVAEASPQRAGGRRKVFLFPVCLFRPRINVGARFDYQATNPLSTPPT